MIRHSRAVLSFTLLLCLLVPGLTGSTRAQDGTDRKLQAKASEKETSRAGEVDASEAQQRRTLVIALVTSLAVEARSYQDRALRPRVMARAADTLWDADSDAARLLFRRAWEAAVDGDADELTLKTKDGAPPMVVALKRMGGHDLRLEVLGLAARRDRALGEEFLTKLKDETKREAENSRNDSSTRDTGDSWSDSEAATKRIQVARELLDHGQIDQALEFAALVLDRVNANSIGFLSALREKRPELADQRFAFLLARAEFDPLADANTVSGLSSYAFTPGIYITFKPDGGTTWREARATDTHPNLPPALRDRFFRTASAILLRPLLQPDQDHTSAGRVGKYNVIKRLLPLFDQYDPNTAAALRSQLASLTGELPANGRDDNNPLVDKGLQPEATSGIVLQTMQDRLDHAKTSRERDSILETAAMALTRKGDVRARAVTERIDDSQLRGQVRRYIDFEFLQLAVRRKDSSEAVRLARAGDLGHIERVWGYTQAARLLMNSQRERAVDLLEEAVAEARRIDGGDPNRARGLIAAATQFIAADRERSWEIINEAVKAADSAAESYSDDTQRSTLPMAKNGEQLTSFHSPDEFTGEETQVRSFELTRNRNLLESVAENPGLMGLLRLLAKDDLTRSVDLAKSFRKDRPRAAAILAIAGAVLEK